MRDAYDKVSDMVENNRDQVKKVAVIAVVVLAAAAIIYYAFFFSASRAQAQFASAYEIYTAPTGPTNNTKAPVFFVTDAEKYKEAAKAFHALANDHGYRYGEVGNYFAGLSELKYDAKTGKATLEQVSRSNSPTGKMAAFALAEQYKQEADYDKAIGIYRTLVTSPGDLPVNNIKLNLADALRLQGKKDDAVAIYFELAKAGRKAAVDAEAARVKDPASKPDGDLTPEVTRQAVERLSLLDPAKVDELPEEPQPNGQFGNF